MNKLLFWLKTSRPGLWFATLWLYLLPTSQMNDIWTNTAFWLGIFYVTFPLNLLVYGWNDIVDAEADSLNPRKDSFLFGAKGKSAELKTLPLVMLLVQLMILPLIIYYAGWQFLILFAGFLLINWLYNLPERGLRSRPPLELLCQIGYLLIVPMSIMLNDTTALPIWSYIYLILFAWQSHLIGEVMDIEPDKLAGKTTTAVVLGMHKTKLIIITIVLLEVLILAFVFDDLFFAGILACGLVWLLLDLFWIYKTKVYSLSEMKLFAYLSNVIAVISMAYVWWSGCLLG